MPWREQPPVIRPSPREALLSSNQLVNNYTRPLGTQYGMGIPNRVCVGATPTVASKPSILLLRTNQSDLRGVNKTSLETGNSTVGTSAEAGFLSNIFLVPKKDGGQRPVINLKALNQFVNTEHFKMEGIHTIKDLLRQGDWLKKMHTLPSPYIRPT